MVDRRTDGGGEHQAVIPPGFPKAEALLGLTASVLEKGVSHPLGHLPMVNPGGLEPISAGGLQQLSCLVEGECP